MKNGGLEGLETRGASPRHLPLDAVKPPPLPTPPSLPIATPKAPNMETSQWNTKNLGLRLGADAISAASAAVLVAPIISIIDRLVTCLPPTRLHNPQLLSPKLT